MPHGSSQAPDARDGSAAPVAPDAAEAPREPAEAPFDADDADARGAPAPLAAPWAPRRDSAPSAPAIRIGDPRARAPRAPLGRPLGQETPRPAPTAAEAPRASGFGAEGAVRRPGAPNVELGFGAEGAVRRPGAPNVELGRVGAPIPGPPGFVRPPAAVHLSPRMTAIFGGLFGLATLTSIIALLIQVVPVRDERAIIAANPSPSASGSAKAAAPPETKKKKRTPVPGPWRIAELAKDPAVSIVSDVMERRSFIAALSDKGVPKAQVYRVMKAFDGLRKFDKTGRKERFTVAMERATRRVRAFEYEVSPSEVYQAREDAAGLLTGAKLDMKIAEEEVVAAFYVGKNLAASYEAGGLEHGVLDVLDDALSGRLSTESFEEGGTVRLIAVEETALGLFSRYKKVIALEYRPADPAQKPTRIYEFTGQEARGYFDERGRQPYAGGWRSPIPGAPVTSRFNPKRMHPVLKKVMPHNGTDLGADTGTPVYSAYRGVVESVGFAGASGNLVTVVHANGITTGYAHLSRFAPGIKSGDRIGTHQLVGYVGSTGRSTGPHLHFSAKKDGKFFDAETLQLDGERVMPGVDRAAFAAAKEALDQRLDAIPLPEPPPEPPEPVKPDPKDAPAAASAAPSAAAAAAAPGAAAAAAVPPDPGDEEPDGEEGAPPAGAQPAAATDDEGEILQGPDLKNYDPNRDPAKQE